jgi:hypothetical protein
VLLGLGGLSLAALLRPSSRTLRLWALVVLVLFCLLGLCGFAFLLWGRSELLVAKPVFAASVMLMLAIPAISVVVLLLPNEVRHASNSAA